VGLLNRRLSSGRGRANSLYVLCYYVDVPPCDPAADSPQAIFIRAFYSSALVMNSFKSRP
jgi:hypothetical protein